MATIHRKTRGGTWYISYRQGGRQLHRSLGTKNERRARELKRGIELVLAENGRPELVVSDRPQKDLKNPDVAEFWTSFSAWAATHRSPSTISEYKIWFERFKEYSKIQTLGDVDVEKVETFKSELLRQGKRKPKDIGLTKVSVNNALKTLRSIWNHAGRMGLYTGPNPFAQVEAFKIPQREERDYLTGEQIDALLDAAKDYGDLKFVRRVDAQNITIAIALLAFAGLRKAEACFARWDWVRWSEKVLVVASHEEFTTKNGRNRVIPIHDKLLEILTVYEEDEGYILKSTRPNEKGCRYRVDFRKCFDRVCKLAGINATPHDLRHSFASRHAVRGRSLHVIAGWLGHSTTWITERYAHFQREYNSEVNDI